MGILEKIENLQKKSEAEKRKILIISMIVIMSAVIVFWFSTLRVSLDSKKENQTAFAPFAVFGDIVADGFKQIKNVYAK